MKLVHIQKVAGVGGSERHLMLLLPGLIAMGHDVRMVVLDAPGSERFVEPMRGMGVSVDVVPAAREADPRTTTRLLQALRRLRPDIVHTHLVHADIHGLTAARLARIPGVSTAHNVDPLWRRRTVMSAARIAYRGARRVLPISEFVRRFVVSEVGLVPAERATVVPYGIDMHMWESNDQQRERARAAFGLDGEELAVGMASRFVEGKGHELLLAAVADACRQAPRMRLLLAGDGPLLPSIRARAEAASLPAKFLGYVDAPEGFMRACDILVFPTSEWLGEGFGLAALEAMAAGVPVIASDAGALPEVVDGAGVVVPAGSVPALSDALADLGRDARKRAALGTAGVRRARDVFSLERMLVSTTDVYEQVLA